MHHRDRSQEMTRVSNDGTRTVSASQVFACTECWHPHTLIPLTLEGFTSLIRFTVHDAQWATVFLLNRSHKSPICLADGSIPKNTLQEWFVPDQLLVSSSDFGFPRAIREKKFCFWRYDGHLWFLGFRSAQPKEGASP